MKQWNKPAYRFVRKSWHVDFVDRSPPRYRVVFTNDERTDAPSKTTSSGDERPHQGKPFLAPLLANDRVTAPDHFQDVRLVRLDIGGSDIQWVDDLWLLWIGGLDRQLMTFGYHVLVAWIYSDWMAFGYRDLMAWIYSELMAFGYHELVAQIYSELMTFGYNEFIGYCELVARYTVSQ